MQRPGNALSKLCDQQKNLKASVSHNPMQEKKRKYIQNKNL